MKTLLALFLLVLSVVLMADAKSDARAASRNVLEIYLDRADGAQTQPDWKTVADWGLQAAQAAWEKGAAAWSEDSGAMAADRQVLNDALSADVTLAWQTWLVNRFYQSVGTMDTLTLLQASAQADRQWLYQTDATGQVVYDAAGNPVVMTKTDAEDANDTAWKAALSGSKQTLLGSWDQNVQAALPELLASPGADGAQLEALAAQLGTAYRDRYKHELDTLYLQQVSRYASTRLYDQFSLKKKSADDTAGTIVDQLIHDVKIGTDSGIQAVKVSLSLDGSTVSADSQVNAVQWEASFRQVLDSGLAKWDVAEKRLLAQRADWENRAGASYQSGEESWAAAYAKLTQERTAWQNQLRQILALGQAEWDGKQAQLSQSITAAASRLDAQMAQEQTAKQQQVAGLVDLYAQAQNLVQTAQTSGEYWFNRMVDPHNLGTQRVYSWTDMNSWASLRIGTMNSSLLTLLNTVNSDISSLSNIVDNAEDYIARKGYYSFHSSTDTYDRPNSAVRYTKNTVTETHGTSNGNVTQTVTSITDWNFVWRDIVTKDINVLVARLNSLKAYKSDLNTKVESLASIKAALTTQSMSSTNQVALKSIENYLNASDTDAQNSWDSYNEAAYWLIKRTAYQTQADGSKNELIQGLQKVMGAGGSPQDILGSSDLETGYLDEYQVAVLKAQVQKQYWDREYQVALQVYTYATDTSSSRPTEAQEEAAWNQALADYQAKKNSYAAAVTALQADGQAVAQRQTSVDAAQKALEAARAALQAAQTEYTTAVSARASGGNTSFYNQQIGSYEKDLEKLYGLDGTVTDTLVDRLAAYRAALRDYGDSQELGMVQSQLQLLVEGVPAQGAGAAMPSLAALQRAAAALLDPVTAVDTPEAVPLADAQYGTASAAVQAIWSTASGAEKDLAAAEYEAYYRAYSQHVTDELRQRQAQVALLVSGSGADWYQSQTGRATGDVAASLRTDSTAAEGKLLEARLKLALDAWGALASGGTAQTSGGRTYAALIVAQENPVAVEAIAWRTALGRLLNAGDAQGWWADPAAHQAAIAALVASETDPVLRASLKKYVAGSSDIVMTGSSDDASNLLTAAARDAVGKAGLLASVWQQGSSFFVGSIAESEGQALADWTSFLATQDWSSDGAIVDSTAIENTVAAWAASNSLEASTSTAVARIRAIEQGLRPDLRDAAEVLALSLLSLAALKGQSGSTDVAGAQSQAQAAHVADAALVSLLKQTASTSLSPTAALKRLSELAAWARGSSSVPSMDTQLDAAFTGVLASAIVQARLASSASDPWADATVSAEAGLTVPSSVEAAALSQAQTLYARLTSGLATLTQLAADPTSTVLGTVGADSQHLDLAMGVWNWFGLGQDAKTAVWRQSLGADAAASVDQLFTAWNDADTADRPGIITVMDGLATSTSAAKATWAWFQTALGGTLTATSDSSHLAQQGQIDVYLAGLTDVTQAGWAGQLFSSLQTEADHGRTDFLAVLTDALGVNPHGQIGDAWTLIQASSRPIDNGADAILTTAYVASMGSTADRGYAAWLLDALGQTLADGNLTMALTDAIVPGLRQALTTAKAAGPLAALRERALAVTLASQTSATQYSFVAGLTGVQSFGDIGASVYGSGQAFDATYSDFFSDQETTDLVLGWYLKAKAVSGSAADPALLNRLSSSARADVGAFLAVLDTANSYVPGLGQDPASFARRSETPADVLAAVTMGGWDDDFYLASLAASGADQASMAVRISAWRQSQLDVLLSEIAAGLASDEARAQADANAADITVQFRQAVAAWQAGIASGGAFRQYLTGLTDASGDPLDTVLHRNLTGADREDQAAYELETAVQRFNDGFGETSSGAMMSDFVSRYARFARGDSDWTAADVYHIPDAVQAAFALASDNLDQTQRQLAADQAQITKLGVIRALVASPPTDAQTDAKAAAVQASLAAYSAALQSLDAVMQSLSSSMSVYNQDYQTSNTAYQSAEDARYAFEAQDQILTYSQNGYLSADDPTLQLAGYQSPTQLVATAMAMKTRSQTVLDMLTAITPSSANAAGQVDAEDVAYRSTTGDLLALSMLQDQLAAQIARQDVIARSYGQTYQKSAEEIVTLTAGSLTNPGNLWAQYLVADPTAGLSLNVDVGTFVLGTRNTAQDAAWTVYTRDPSTYDAFIAGSLNDNVQRWLASMQSWEKSDASKYQDTLKTWGLAYDYLLYRIKAENTGLDLDKLLGSSGTADLNIASDQSLDDFLLSTANDLKRDIEGKGGNNNYTYLASYRNWMRTQLQNAWNSVKADTAHWQLFQNALALQLSGGLKDGSCFTQSASQKAFQYIRDQAQKEADSHNRDAAVLGGIAGGWAASAAASSFWNPGFAIYCAVQAGIFGVLAGDAHQNGVQQQNAADMAKNAYNGDQKLINGGLAIGDLDGEAISWANYSQNWNILQTLKGAKAGTTQITVTTLELSLSTALAQRHTSLSAADRSTIEREFGRLSAADKTDSVTAMAAIVRLSQGRQNNAKQDLSSRFASLQTQFQADESAYRVLEVRYLAGDASVTLGQLKAQARAVYGSPVYIALVQAQKQLAEDSAAVAAATTPLTGMESQKAALVSRIAATINQLEAVLLAHLKDVRLNEWAVRQQELNAQQQRWQNQINATVVKSQQGWSDSFNKLSTGYRTWRASFAQEYQNKSSAWSDVYYGFQWGRRQWVDAVAANADRAQNQVWAISAGQAADAAISRGALTLIGDVGAGMVSADSIVSQILGTSSLDSYLKGAQRINAGLAAASAGLRQGLKYDVSTVNALAAITMQQNQRDEDLAHHAALIVAAQARDNLAEAQESYEQQVAAANESVDAQMDQTFLGTGYGKTNGHYQRRSIIGSTIVGPLYESQSVDTYKPFTSYDFSVQTSLDDTSLKGLDSGAVQARVDTALQELKNKAIDIFGPSDSEDVSGDKVFEFRINGGDKKTDVSKVNQDVQRFKDSGDNAQGRTVVKTVRAGAFNQHLGYSPEMKSAPDLDNDDMQAGYRASVLVPGTGEAGRLIGWYQYFSMRASKGWAEQDQPFYSQKLYDDRHSWIKAPTLKDVAMTGVGIAAAMTTGGAGGALIGALETTAASAVFAMADVAHGADAGETWGTFAKGAVVTGLTTALTMGMSDFAKGFNGMGGYSGTLAKTAYATGMAGASKGISTAVNAIDWTDGRIGFDTGSFEAQWDPANAANYASIIMAGTSAGVSSFVNQGGYGFLNDKLVSYNEVGNLAGSLVSAGVSYAMTGDAAFNVANFSMFSQKDNTGHIASSGLLELHVGDHGISMNLGQDGADVSYQAMRAAGNGFKVWDENTAINARAAEIQAQGFKENLSVGMRSLASNIDASSSALYASIMGGSTTFQDDSGLNAMAQTTTTLGNRVISLGTQRTGNDGLDMSVLLAHEAVRDGVWDNGEAQTLETREAAMNHMNMAMMIQDNYGSGLSGTNAAEGNLYAAYKAGAISESAMNGYVEKTYSSAGDFWKLTKNGNIAYDGRANLYDENGNMIRQTTSQGIEGSMLEILGLSDTPSNRDAVIKMMKASGMQMDVNGYWLGADASVLEKVPFGGDSGFYTKNHVDLTRENYEKTISLYSIDQLYQSLGANKGTYRRFIEKNYGSAMGYLSYSDAQTDQVPTGDMYRQAYSGSERNMIETNIAYFQSVQKNGIDYKSVVPGATQTTDFDVNVYAALASSSIPGAAFFSEDHTGYDFSGNGTINSPGGEWQVVDKMKDKLYLQLFGTDLKMRIQHLDSSATSDLALGQILGGLQGDTTIADFPQFSNGSGTGPHVHIDFTRSQPSDGVYRRVFVDPSNWNAGTHLEYQYSYLDVNKSILPGYPKYFDRY